MSGLFASLTGAAQTPTHLVFSFTNETTQSFLLADKPEITFSGANYVVKSSTVETSFPVSQVVDYHFVIDNTSPTNVREAVSSNNDLQFVFLDNAQIIIKGLPLTEKVYVYNLMGTPLITAGADAQGIADISIASLSKGMYLVKTNGRTYKIVKR